MSKLSRFHVFTVLMIGAGAFALLALVTHFGWSAVAGSLARLGAGGFVVFCVYALGVFALLGWAWRVIVPNSPIDQFPGFIFGRIMREVAADILPFSQLGGFIVGVRGACLLGVPVSIAIASTIVDLGAEMLGQLLFTAAGLAVLSLSPPHGFPHKLLDPALAIGLLIGVVTTGAFIFSQRLGLSALNKLSARWPAAMRAQVSSAHLALIELYRRPARVAAAAGLHFIAWLAASGGVWLILNLMGAPLRPSAVLAMESLVYLLRSAAFFVPGAIGVVEGGYVLLGPVFGLPPDIALSVALIKRGRDLAIGLPALCAWQLLEGKGLLRRNLA